MNVDILSPFLVDRIGWVLVHSIWQIAAIALVVAIILRFLPTASSNLRYSVCLLGLISIAVAPWLTLGVLPNSAANRLAADRAVTSVENSATDSISVAPPSVPGDRHQILLDDDLIQAYIPVTNRPVSETSWTDSLRDGISPWLQPLVITWYLGVVLFAIRPLWSWFTIFRLKRYGVSEASDQITSQLGQAVSKLGLKSIPKLLLSTQARVPMLIGYFRPLILLPVAAVSGLSTQQLEAVLLHELAHVRRHDYLVNFAQTILETVFFYHPSLWWLSKQLRHERECCCDVAAANAIGSRSEYGRALLALEEIRGGTTSLALGANDGSLLARVQRLTGTEPRKRTNPLAIALMVTTWVLVTMVGWSQSPDKGVAGSGDKPSTIRSEETITDSNDDSSAIDSALARHAKRTAEMNLLKAGATWPEEKLRRVNFGPSAENGLRVGWLFEPELSQYPVGTILETRVVFQNTGSHAVQFATNLFRQNDRWMVRRNPGPGADLYSSQYTGGPSHGRYLLQPGEVIDVDGGGFAIGNGDYKEAYGLGKIVRRVTAQPGETFSVSGDVYLRDLAKDVILPPLQGDWTGILKAGEAKFHVVARNSATENSTSAQNQNGDPQGDKAEKTQPPNRSSEPIVITGRAIDPTGMPIANARIFVNSLSRGHSKLGETKTSADGTFRFDNLELPITRPPQSAAFTSAAFALGPNGRFQVFGIAEGFGFAWQPEMDRYTAPKSKSVTLHQETPKRSFFPGEKIDLDLQFSKPATLRGRLVDQTGSPIAKAKIGLWNVERTPSDGYGNASDFSIIGPTGFASLYDRKIMPDELRNRTTDDQGWFEYSELPDDCDFRVSISPGKGFASRMIYVTTADVKNFRFDDPVIHENGMTLTFADTVQLPVVVTYGDTKKAAPYVRVGLGNTNSGGSSCLTDSKGLGTINVPVGEYSVHVLTQYQTPYISIENGKHIVTIKSDPEPLRIELKRAAEVEVTVLDAETGTPLRNVDLWIYDKGFRDDYRWRSYRRPNISMVERPKTGADGQMVVFMKPGSHKIGAGHNHRPKGYFVGTQPADGVTVQCVAGQTQSVTFKLQKTKPKRNP